MFIHYVTLMPLISEANDFSREQVEKLIGSKTADRP